MIRDVSLDEFWNNFSIHIRDNRTKAEGWVPVKEFFAELVLEVTKLGENDGENTK